MDFSMMPTAAKLVASCFFAALGFMAASLVWNHYLVLHPGSQIGTFAYWCAFFGFLAGYRWSGRRAGDGLKSGFGLGLTTVFLMLLWSIAAFAGKKTYDESIKKRFDGVMDAFQGFVKTLLEYGQDYLLYPDVIGLLIVGGLFGGWLTERTARAFP